MKKLSSLAVLVAMALLVSCSKNGNLVKMIPADATGVVCIDVPSILQKADMLRDGSVVVPDQLGAVLDANDAATLCQVITDLPVMGVDVQSKAYAFFTNGTFSSALLVALSDEEAAVKTLAQRAGGDFNTADGVRCLQQRDVIYVVAKGTLLVARLSKAGGNNAPAQAKAIIEQRAHDFASTEQAKLCLDVDADVSAWLSLDALKSFVKRNKTLDEVMQKVPVFSIFLQSDVKAVTCALNIDADKALLTTKFIADEGSDYLKFAETVGAQPDAQVLKVIPNSMNYIVAMSLKGDKVVQLPQVKQLIDLFGQMPMMNRFDLSGALSSVDGSVAVGLSPDPYLEGEWNAVIAAHSSSPESVVKAISTFAQAMGQAPEIYNGEYVYQYANKMIKVGVNGSIIYLKMLNYEQTEGNAGDDAALNALFGSSPMALSLRLGGDAAAHFTYGLSNAVDGSGTFTPAQGEKSAALALIKALCAVKPPAAYDDMLDDDDMSDVLPKGVKLHTLN